METFKKQYKDYPEYIDHQKGKLDKENYWIQGFDENYSKILNERLFIDFTAHNIEKGNALCLGARLGGEVRAFIKLGFFAVGIDLNPGEKNPHVLHGDFQDLQFPDRSVDIVFSNSLDHSFDIDKVMKEIKRVLKKDGFLILEMAYGYEEGIKTGPYESFHWAKVGDMIKFIEEHEFTLIKRLGIVSPESGAHCVFKNG
ncbi:unnamed protein product [marine sediment metagenome]|uniref:Methyltransferase type 11 domain-containing protein n=1 Tax=marine sediment metagenome TaxID=412755 RepID=X0TXW8_9ZZZZ